MGEFKKSWRSSQAKAGHSEERISLWVIIWELGGIQRVKKKKKTQLYREAEICTWP